MNRQVVARQFANEYILHQLDVKDGNDDYVAHHGSVGVGDLQLPFSDRVSRKCKNLYSIIEPHEHATLITLIKPK